MLHVSLNFQCGAFTVLLSHTTVFLALIQSCHSIVSGPSQPIVAIVGEDIIMPSQLIPVMDAFDMTVMWGRPGLVPEFFLTWSVGESIKHPSYKGRISLFTEELRHGNVSLKLSNVKRSDEGTYRCFLPELDGSTYVKLVVGAVSLPVVNVTKTMREVVLQCESEGWYPQPEVLWLDAEGKLLSAGPTETLRGPEALYTVSSRVTVEKRLSNIFTCRVQQRDINQSRETHVHVPDDFFMVPSSPGSQHIIIGSVIGSVLAILAIGLVVWKWRQKKFKNKRGSPEDGLEQTQEEKTVTSTSDNTGFQVVMEAEGERAPLLAGREEDHVGNRGGEEIKSESEHKDNTPQNQCVTKPHMDRTEGGKAATSVNHEQVPFVPKEGGTDTNQDMIGGQGKSDAAKGEGGQTIVKDNVESGLPLVNTEGEKEQQQNVHHDQEVQEVEEKHQGMMTFEGNSDIPSKTAKKKNKRKTAKKGGSEQRKQQENWSEPMPPEAERTRVENQSEIQNGGETEKKETVFTFRMGNQHVFEDRRLKGGEAEEDEKEAHQKGNQSNIHSSSEMRVENQRVEDEPKVENKRTVQETQNRKDAEKEKIPLKTPEEVKLTRDSSKQEAGHEEKKGKDERGNQRNVRRMTEREAENKKEPIDKKVEDTEEKVCPSVSREVTHKPEFQINQLKSGHQQDTSVMNLDETKEEQGLSKKCQERQTEGLQTDNRADKKRQEAQQQAAQQVDEDKKGIDERGNQRNVRRTTERKAGSQHDKNRTEETQVGESVRRKVSENLNVKGNQGTAERQNCNRPEDSELQAGNLQEDTSLMNQEENKQQPEHLTKRREWEKRRKGFQSDKGADFNETPENKKIRGEVQQQAGGQMDQMEGIREQIEDNTNTGREVQGQEEQHVQLMENDGRKQLIAKRRLKQQHKEEKKPQVHQRHTFQKKNHEAEGSDQTQDISQKLKYEETLMEVNTSQDQAAQEGQDVVMDSQEGDEDMEDEDL
ncbi:hypothetical protein PBY51_003565 [Eleginops maclovinus]|uniref:Ig-like domain-containing protein n=2 Tax=Eleginops maclovinus TaxID=56733 RepID=A0AAN7Y1N6_ELEMC|nr:hypothetical protein PBY51_003565 [Eleginops maclovinus]